MAKLGKSQFVTAEVKDVIKTAQFRQFPSPSQENGLRILLEAKKEPIIQQLIT